MRRVGVAIIYLTLVLAFFQRSTEEVRWNELGLALLVAAAFGASLFRIIVSKRLRGTAFTVPLLTFVFGWLPLNLMWAVANGVDLILALRRAAPLIAFGVVAITIAQLFRTLAELRLAYGLIVSGSLLLIIAGFPSIAKLDVIHFQEFRQLSGMMGGYYSLLGTTLLLPLAITTQNKFDRLVKGAGFLLVFIGMILSLTRSYWLVGIVSIFFMNMFIKLRRVTIIAIGFLIFITVIAIKQPVLISVITKRLVDFTLLWNDPSVLNRWQEIRGALEALLETPIVPLLGRGIGREFSFYSIDSFYPKGMGYVTTDYLHNFYIYLWLQLGLPGLVLLIYPIIIICIRGIKTRHFIPAGIRGLTAGTVVCLLGFLAANIVAPPLLFIGAAVHLGAIAGISYILTRISEVTKKSDCKRGPRNEMP